MSGAPRDGEHTVLSVLRGAEAWLARRGVDAPKRSAELLVGFVLGMDRLRLYLAHDRPLDENERARLRALVQRRGDGVPVAYLIGSWSFRGHELQVGPAVLIPRPETEELVSIALQRAPQDARAIDLGTGSGAIALALAVERPDLRVFATDVSRNALSIAAANAERLGVADRVEFAAGDWWDAVPAERTFHLVVSNPPYIDPKAPQGLADDVKAHEPPLALFSAAGDAVSCYRAITADLAARLEPGGWFVAETGVGASDAALELLRAEAALTDVDLLRDTAGIARHLIARRA
jgi:release factor glutamine methyltransferase